MSYCVNCGVELAESEKICPLCSTPVVHPGKIDPEDDRALYPRHVEHVYRGIDRRYGALLALISLTVPIACSIVIDLFVVHAICWSLYVTGAAMCIFVFVLFPLILKRPNPYLHILYDTAALLLYSAGILFSIGEAGAFYWLASPLILASCALAYGVTPVIRSKKLAGRLYKPAITLFMLSAFYIVVELVIDLYQTSAFSPIWSLIAASSCIVTALMLIMIEGKQKLKDNIRRRLLL